MAVGDEAEFKVYCSCGDVLRGQVEETEISYETRVLDAAPHMEAGHTVWVRGRPVNMDLILASQGRPASKRMNAPTYTDPR